MKLGIGLIYVAWYAFVFSMCYFFSPWFVLLIMLRFAFKVMEPTLEFFGDIICFKIRRKTKAIVDPVIIEKIEYEVIEEEIKQRLSKRFQGGEM